MKRKILIGFLIIILISLILINADYLTSTLTSKIIAANVEDIPGSANADTHPVILLHGFNPSYSRRIGEFTMKDLQNQLATDLNYQDKGLYTKETTCAELQYTDTPIIIRASYFEGTALVEIEEYANNLEGIIKRILYCTGAEQVDLVTHSMGGIVARYYINNIDNTKTRKLVMLATPNHGGLYNIGILSNFFVDEGESKLALDFIQLSEDHDFMATLNEIETPEKVDYYTIAGNKDGQGDGLVLETSVPLEGATNTLVECGHIFIKHPTLCPDGFEAVKQALN